VDADGGIDLDAVAVVSRLVSDALDADAENPASPRALAGAYVLEVSSPGTERPLTLPRHFRRNVGRLVELAGPAQAPVTGRIIRADEDSFTLSVAGTKGATSEQSFSYDDSLRGTVQVEFNRSSD